MLRDLLLAIGIPTALLLLFTVLLQRGTPLPTWLQRLSERSDRLWTVGIGLLITLSFLRWLLQR
jgi:hypothetical protein